MAFPHQSAGVGGVSGGVELSPPLSRVAPGVASMVDALDQGWENFLTGRALMGSKM